MRAFGREDDGVAGPQRVLVKATAGEYDPATGRVAVHLPGGQTISVDAASLK